MTDSVGRGQRIGIFGGTFNPPHRGHLIVAESVRRQVSLDRIIFVPSFISPHKQEKGTASGERRTKMLRLLVQGIPALEVSDCEIRREGVSYTVDTIRHFRELHPSARLFLLVGMDNVAEFRTWREPDEILQLATLVVMTRPGSEVTPMEGMEAESVHVCTVPAIAISSTEIRGLIRDGKSVRHLVPDKLFRYIKRTQTYC